MSGHNRELRAAASLSRRIATWRIAHQLTANQADVLVQVLDAGAVSAAELSRLIGITTASMSRMLPSLEEAGWIVRELDQADGRRMVVQPSKRLVRSLSEAFSARGPRRASVETEVVRHA